MPKKIAVIGAGPGGLAAAMLLASKGYKVDVYEKQAFIGGRNGAMKIDGFTFDIGPTFLSMPEIAEELFEASGRNLHDYIDLKELKHLYRLYFSDKEVDMYRDPEKMKREIAAHFPGDEKNYDAFMNDTRKKMDRLKPILQNKMDSFHQYLSWNVLRALPQLSLGKSVYDVLSEYFTHEQLKLAFTFQSKYLGMSPWECPGAFSILSWMEHEYGIYHPIGGLNQLSEAMAKVVKEYGGTIHLSNGVKKLNLDKQKTIQSLQLDNGETVEVDEVVINGDFAHVMTNLVDEGVLTKFSSEKLEKKHYSCSTFMIYLGIDKKYEELPHHSVLFANDYKKNVEEITKTYTLPENPSIYVQNASVTDETLAPEGQSTLYILAPVPNNSSDIAWDEVQDDFKNLVLQTVMEKLGLKDLQEHIVVERVISPVNWEKDLYVYKGATFNLGHQLTQMMALRPHNKFEELGSCWLVGGGTHPGSGLPTILESARITTDLLIKEDRVTEKVIS